jgi:hypothetical protein
MFSMLESLKKWVATFIFKFCSKRNGVNGGGKRGHEKNGRAFSEIKSFKDNHMFVITSIKEEERAFVAKNFKAQKVEWWHRGFTKRGQLWNMHCDKRRWHGIEVIYK